MGYPNFLLIGANKSGTSSLASYLNEHPQVYVSPMKEPRFFVLESSGSARRRRVDRSGHGTSTLASYLRLFDAVQDERAVGEASTNYLSEPIAPLAIHRHVPDAKIVAILRHPAERAFSNYSVFVHRGMEKLSFDEAVRAELDHVQPRGHWHRRYVRLGFYGTQLARYFTRFDHRQIRVLLYDDLRRDPLGLMREVYRFLGVDDTFAPDLTRRYNVTVVPRRPTLHKLLKGSSGLGPIVRKALPGALRARLDGLTGGVEQAPLEFPPETRQLLIDLYRSDVLQLQDLIGRDLSAWME